MTSCDKKARGAVPDAQCRGHSRFQRFNFLPTGIVHKLALFILRSREKSMRSVVMFIER